MSDRPRIKEISMDDVLPSEKGGKYPVNTLMNLYIATHADPESFAKQWGIGKNELVNYIKTFKWDEFRDKHFQNQMLMIQKMREESLAEEIALDQKEQMYKRFQRMQYLDSVAEYYKAHGHLFVIKEKQDPKEPDQILYDHYGMPVQIPIGEEDAAKYRREIMGNIELQLKVLKQAELEGKKPIRVNPSPASSPLALTDGKARAKALLESED